MHVWLKKTWDADAQTCHGLLVGHEGNAERVDFDVYGTLEYRQNDSMPGCGWHKSTNEDTMHFYAG
jgi:hypothetical protein